MAEHSPADLEAGAPVLLDRAGPVATVTLNRPSHHNAINRVAWEALARCAGHLADDPATRVVVLTGAGREAFSAGADISEFPTERLDRPAAGRYGALAERALGAWQALPQPVIARLSGYCLGAGLELALTADFRLAAANAVFGIPASRRGFGVSIGDVRRLGAVVGVARAKALLLSGELVPADAARAMGLLDEVATLETLDERVQQLVAILLTNAPLAMTWVKQASAIAAAGAEDLALSPEEQVGAHIFATQDCAEGVASFLERRSPEFRGE